MPSSRWEYVSMVWTIEGEVYARRLRLAVDEVALGDDTNLPQYTSDPEGDLYVHAAVLTRASYLLSGDKDILSMKDQPVSPVQFARLWESNLL
jgi:uncharacterized protein